MGSERYGLVSEVEPLFTSKVPAVVGCASGHTQAHLISSHLSAYGDLFREVDRLRDEVGWLREEQVSREQAVWPPPRTAFMAGRAAFLALNRLGGRVLAGKERPLAVANGLILFQLRRTSSYRM
jgi:hypothetical protein